MYLSDRDLQWAIETEKLIVDPLPEHIDPTSIDLHLDSADEAKIWDIAKYLGDQKSRGESRPELRVGRYVLAEFSDKYLAPPPEHDENAPDQLVGRRANQIVVRRGGFVLWQTKETVGTPDKNADLICFVDGKSTKARAGIVVHLTAPTIHASWKGKITLEIVNLGPFDLVLEENDVIAQIVVAKVTSPPLKAMAATSVTYGQRVVDGTR